MQKTPMDKIKGWETKMTRRIRRQFGTKGDDTMTGHLLHKDAEKGKDNLANDGALLVRNYCRKFAEEQWDGHVTNDLTLFWKL